MLLLRDLPKYECIADKARRYPEVDPTAVLCCLQLLRVASDVLARLEAHFAANGLSQGRFTVMMLLNREGAQFSVSDLADLACVTPATMTGLLDGLEREGHVVRRPNTADRRMINIELTDSGRTHLEAMLPGYFRLIAEIMGNVSEQDRARLSRLLQHISPRPEIEAGCTSGSPAAASDPCGATNTTEQVR